MRLHEALINMHSACERVGVPLPPIVLPGAALQSLRSSIETDLGAHIYRDIPIGGPFMFGGIEFVPITAPDTAQ